nr:hypothetical protein [Candidatus Sigynarchaeota archaeon]
PVMGQARAPYQAPTQYRPQAPAPNEHAPWNQATDFGANIQPPAMRMAMSMHPQVQAMLHTHELDQRMQRANQTKYLAAVMRSCEQKQIAIRETMKNLDYKFELGKIAPNVYFQTHTLFAERLVALDQEIQDIKVQLQQNHAALTRATHY